MPEEPAQGDGKPITVVGATGNNLQGRRRRHSRSATVDLRHRRLRRRQVDARQRHALQGRWPTPERRAPHARRRTKRSTASTISTRSSTSTSRRSAARRARTRRPTPALFTPIRDWFADCRRRARAATSPGAFSFNVKGGRCEACQGDGVIKIEMHFLPDVYVTCDVCHGKRYNRETLEIRYKGKNIADVLDMTVEDGAASSSRRSRRSATSCRRCCDVGLGYIRSGSRRRRCRAARRSASSSPELAPDLDGPSPRTASVSRRTPRALPSCAARTPIRCRWISGSTTSRTTRCACSSTRRRWSQGTRNCRRRRLAGRERLRIVGQRGIVQLPVRAGRQALVVPAERRSVSVRSRQRRDASS